MIVEASGIEKWYFRGKGQSNRFFAVRQTDFRLEPGKVCVLTGRSGSGKTTLMHMLSGLLTPSAGIVKADGQALYGMNDDALSRFRNQHFGMIPQGADVLPELTVMENILLAQGIFALSGNSAKNRPGQGKSAQTGWKNMEQDSRYAKQAVQSTPEGMQGEAAQNRPETMQGEAVGSRPETMQERTAEWMGRLDISSLGGVPARELSGGERRRLCIVRALAASPDIIFADEPTSDLDDENMQIVLQMLREAADGGAAVFIVTHDSEALDYADVRFRMNGGELEKIG